MAKQLTRRQIRRLAEERYEREPVYADAARRSGGAGAWLGALLFLVAGVLGLWVAQAHGYVAVPIPMEALTPPNPHPLTPAAPFSLALASIVIERYDPAWVIAIRA